MHYIILACATLLQLSLSTQLEMNHVIPGVGTFCLANHGGSVVVRYEMKH